MDRQLRLFLFAMDRFELRLRIEVGRARNSLITRAAGAYAGNVHVPTWLIESHKKRLKNVLDAHYRLVIPHFGRQAISQIKSRKIERKAMDGIFEHLMLEWIGREALRKASMISATDRDAVQDAITDGIEAAEGTAAIASRIRKVSALTPFRAATIARTETHAAATFGSLESVRGAERELGVRMLKSWLPTIDDRTRPEHAAMANHPAIPLGEQFSVGGEMMDRPGDPSASPENQINCRCSMAFSEAA